MNRKLLLVALLGSSLCYAASEEGTGAPSIEMAVTQDNWVVMSLDESSIYAVGAHGLNKGYAQLALDSVQYGTGTIQAGWGRAEVFVGCGQADVIVYRQINGEWVEYAVDRVAVNNCLVD